MAIVKYQHGDAETAMVICVAFQKSLIVSGLYCIIEFFLNYHVFHLYLINNLRLLHTKLRTILGSSMTVFIMSAVIGTKVM